MEIYESKRKGLLKSIEQAHKTGKSSSAFEDQLAMLEEPSPAKQKTLVLSSATRQKLVEFASRGNERGMLIKRDELIGWFNELERNGADGEREFFTEAMTVTHHFSHHTLGRGTDDVPILAISVAGCVQPGKLARHLRAMESGARDDGLMQRFLWIWPEKPGFGSFDSAHALGFRGMSAELLHSVETLYKGLDSLTPEQIGAVQNGLTPAPWIGFEEQAQSAFLKWRKVLRSQTMEQDDLPDGYISWLGKSERLVSGLALSFHCVAAVNQSDEYSQHGISLACLHRAVDCWDTLKHHALRVFSMGQSTPLESAHLLLGKLNMLSQEFTLRELKRKCWRGLRDEKVLGEALDLLVDHHYLIEQEPVRNPKGGRPPSRSFSVNPITDEKA
jgi:hypothetical protein